MSTGHEPYFLLDVPERGLGDYYAIVQDMADLGYRVELSELFDMGVFAIGRVGRHPERLPDVAAVIYSETVDLFDPRVDAELACELILNVIEIAYLDLAVPLHHFNLVNHRVFVAAVNESGILLEV